MISFWSLMKQQRNRLGTRHFLQLPLLHQLQTGACGPSCSLIQRVFSERSSPRHPTPGSSPPAALLCGPLFTFPPRSCSCTWGVSSGTGSETRAAAFPPVLSSKPGERTSLPEIHITAGALEGQGPAAAVAKATRGAEKSRGSGLASRGQGVEGRTKGRAQVHCLGASVPNVNRGSLCLLRMASAPRSEHPAASHRQVFLSICHIRGPPGPAEPFLLYTSSLPPARLQSHPPLLSSSVGTPFSLLSQV